jgi:hypothetical protein
LTYEQCSELWTSEQEGVEGVGWGYAIAGVGELVEETEAVMKLVLVMTKMKGG